ncbi:MAG: hypothetical protein EOP84_34560 [Verrucomicrobiaceae bacterium]|nr:MAG: hypothetical protein EOP84_34560 [Verrucomicrobiaceae bacterium]
MHRRQCCLRHQLPGNPSCSGKRSSGRTRNLET